MGKKNAVLSDASQPLELVKTALEQVAHFAGLPESIQREIAASAQRRQFDPGEVIYLEGEPAETVYVLLSGWVKATRMSLQGREQAMQVLRPIDIFGDVAVFAKQPYPATVTALEAVQVLTIPARLVISLAEQHPQLALAVSRRMAERVIYYVALVEDFALRSVEARLASTLLRNAEEREGQWIVPRRSWTTYDEMAARLGTVRDVLSRTLKTLEAQGLLRVGKQDILLLNIHELIARANS